MIKSKRENTDKARIYQPYLLGHFELRLKDCTTLGNYTDIWSPEKRVLSREASSTPCGSLTES